MFEEYNEIFKKVLKLASEKRENKKSYSSQEFSNSLEEWRNKRDPKIVELEEFLNGLDFEIVKIIQTIMYIGRDNKTDSRNPEQIYINERECFDKKGWQKQSIEVSQITQKAPLYEYFRDGLKKLEIRLRY